MEMERQMEMEMDMERQMEMDGWPMRSSGKTKAKGSGFKIQD